MPHKPAGKGEVPSCLHHVTREGSSRAPRKINSSGQFRCVIRGGILTATGRSRASEFD